MCEKHMAFFVSSRAEHCSGETMETKKATRASGMAFHLDYGRGKDRAQRNPFTSVNSE